MDGDAGTKSAWLAIFTHWNPRHAVQLHRKVFPMVTLLAAAGADTTGCRQAAIEPRATGTLPPIRTVQGQQGTVVAVSPQTLRTLNKTIVLATRRSCIRTAMNTDPTWQTAAIVQLEKTTTEPVTKWYNVVAMVLSKHRRAASYSLRRRANSNRLAVHPVAASPNPLAVKVLSQAVRPRLAAAARSSHRPAVHLPANRQPTSPAVHLAAAAAAAVVAGPLAEIVTILGTNTVPIGMW